MTPAESVEQTVEMSLLGLNEYTSADIFERLDIINLMQKANLSKEEIDDIAKRLEAKLQFNMNLGHTLHDSSHKPWLHSERENIEWYYWNRYKKMLIKDNFGAKIIPKIDLITDEILDLLQNPNDGGKWQRKGLVVGDVQSGKTANYSGLICKALDSGYRIVIVLAGLLNSLRKQTQVRIDSSVIGIDSTLMLKNDLPLSEKVIGVGSFDCLKWPVSITTALNDFKRSIAVTQQTAISQYKQPLVFIVKKNVSILNNLTDWLKSNNFDLSDYPMLLIDDEADHASINTKKSELDPAKTNASIRNLLSIFPKNVYLGYTATPFANIFINPDTPEEMMSDLFPENFIKNLDAPDNYFGAKTIFLKDNNRIIKTIDDHIDIIPPKHKINLDPQALPESLKEAVRTFILVCTLRILRGHINKHNSMLVNITRFTCVQTRFKYLIHDYLKEFEDAIKGYSYLPANEALRNTVLNSLYQTFYKEYRDSGFEWAEVQSKLKIAISKIEIKEVNYSTDGEKELDYSSRNYPGGRYIIAIGGLSLSRGITLEGLSVSYFLRNSIMYDTLMQMGRWFGYRTGYDDLCRLYMTDEAIGWYRHIALATEELRDEFRKMDSLGKTPKDFGLCVRNHPESLIVTARNKMRTSKTVTREIDVTGRLIETSRLFTDPKKNKSNLMQMAMLFEKVSKNCSPCEKMGNHLFWGRVPYQYVSDFVESFINHPESSLTDSVAVKDYVRILAQEENINEWEVVFVSIGNKNPNITIDIPSLSVINPSLRGNVSLTHGGIMLSQRKLASGNFDEKFTNGNTRETPLLMLYILDCRFGAPKENNPIFPNGAAAYGIAFPGEKQGKRIKRLATYQVNTTWMKEQYGYENEDDSDLGDDI